jgi:hypothetical protein
LGNEPIPRRSGNPNRDAAGQRDTGRIGYVRGVRNEDLITRIEQRPQRQVESLADADGDQDLILRVVLQAVAAGQL